MQKKSFNICFSTVKNSNFTSFFLISLGHNLGHLIIFSYFLKVFIILKFNTIQILNNYF